MIDKSNPPTWAVESREALAAYAHEAWSGWMKYMFSKCMDEDNNGQIIPNDLVARWKRQMNTPYRNLPKSEKASDRDEADKILATLSETVETLVMQRDDAVEAITKRTQTNQCLTQQWNQLKAELDTLQATQHEVVQMLEKWIKIGLREATVQDCQEANALLAKLKDQTRIK